MEHLPLPHQTFQAIYRNQAWGCGSGPGSSPANRVEYRAFVERFIEANGVRSVTDLGCGDWQFSRLIDWSQVEYLGLDLVPEVVAQNRNRFAGDNIRFDVFSVIDNLSGGDLLLSKEVVQHLPNKVVAEYLAIIRQKYKFALLTNTRHADNQSEYRYCRWRVPSRAAAGPAIRCARSRRIVLLSAVGKHVLEERHFSDARRRAKSAARPPPIIIGLKHSK
jgi:SAM-dependent methyltransferase